MERKENNAAKQWYPVYTKAKSEKKAYQALTGKSIEAYLPLNRQLKQWSDRKKWVEEPFLKSYIFVNIAPHEQAEVLMTNGISRFLYFSGKPATMPARQITDLKLLMASPFELEVTALNLQVGEKIEIKAGPLKGMRGEIISHKSQKQLILRLESIGYSIIVNAMTSYVERI